MLVVIPGKWTPAEDLNAQVHYVFILFSHWMPDKKRWAEEKGPIITN